MRKNTIFTLVMIILSCLLAYALAIGFDNIDPHQGIYNKIKTDEQIKLSEREVITRLEHIREVQKAYFNEYKTYAPTWDTLYAYMDSGVIYEVSKREVIIPAEEVRPPEELYKGDSVRFEYDTLGSQGVIQKLFPKNKKEFKDFDPNMLKYIPNTNNIEFKMSTGKIEKAGLTISVLEVVDVQPVNPQRKETNENPKMRYLRFGSLTEVTLGGNWED